MSGALQVNGLGKSYRQWGGELRRMASWFISSITPREEHWVLRNVSFAVRPGEAVGIIGQNGAGKSTLLKLITGTVQPTEGHVHMSGRVAAILELGMGFNPDMTGRQNAFHSAGLMGYSRAEIEGVLNEMPGVAESAVIGVPHADFGEAVVAVVVRKPAASPDAGKLIAQLKAKIANFKVPKQVFVVDELPRNAMGKVQKNLLRERHAGAFQGQG